MTISSRTPEGEPNTCPVCGRHVHIEPSTPFSDAPCPHCGHLLWFVRVGDRPVLIQPGDAARDRDLSALLAETLGLSEAELLDDPALLDRLDLDSLDTAELIMEFGDEAFD